MRCIQSILEVSFQIRYGQVMDMYHIEFVLLFEIVFVQVDVHFLWDKVAIISVISHHHTRYWLKEIWEMENLQFIFVFPNWGQKFTSNKFKKLSLTTWSLDPRKHDQELNVADLNDLIEVLYDVYWCPFQLVYIK